MERRPDWTERLGRALRERLSAPFEWGVNDCAIFAADCVLAQTGVDLANGLRGEYANQEEAEALLRDRGWGDLAGLADAFLARRSDWARKGDVVLLKGQLGPFLAISLGGDVAIAPAGDRARQVRTRSVLGVWAVG